MPVPAVEIGRYFQERPAVSGLPKSEQPSPTVSALVTLGREKLGKNPWAKAPDGAGNQIAIYGKGFAQGWAQTASVDMCIEVRNSVPYPKDSSAYFLIFSDGEVWAVLRNKGEVFSQELKQGSIFPRWGDGQVRETTVRALTDHIKGVTEPFQPFTVSD